MKVEVAVVYYSDAPIWNLADIPITDNGSEISADSRFDIQLCSLLSTYFHSFGANFPINMGYQYTFCNIADIRNQYFWPI